ncbi:MAG: TPM domain-containing protein [Muribaculaceae bacterium]|nr:TPM domain-containing protein [Muribaculaceae bacterium]
MALADFIPSEGQRRIADAITAAERHTTGEICVHVTPRCRGNVMKRATRTFNRLHLYSTKRRNAVLIFIAYEARKLAILGDTGINDVIPEGFWDNEVEELTRYLKAGRPVDGLCEIIAHMGERLSEFFPGERDDENELSNEVTFDDIDDDDEVDDDHHDDDDYGNME